MTSIAQPVDLSVEAAQAAFLHEQERIRWRRRLLPVARYRDDPARMGCSRVCPEGAALRGTLTQLVAFTLYSKFGLLMANLWPTAVRRSSVFCSAISRQS